MLIRAFVAFALFCLVDAKVRGYASPVQTKKTGEVMWSQRVVTSDAIPAFIKRGGKLKYLPIHTSSGWNWELWAISPDASRTHVVSSKTGEPRVFKTADAVLAFHLRQYPYASGLFIPVAPEQHGIAAT